MACHDIGKVAEGLRSVSVCSDVNVYTASSGRIAFCSGVAEEADKFLQGFHVSVGKNWRYQFALFAVRTRNADILLEFPFSVLCIPSRPGAVSVSGGCVLDSSSSEEIGGNLGCLFSGDVVHFNLDPDGLAFHFCNLLCGAFVHCVFLRFRCFPLGVAVYYRHFGDISRPFRDIYYTMFQGKKCGYYGVLSPFRAAAVILAPSRKPS